MPHPSVIIYIWMILLIFLISRICYPTLLLLYTGSLWFVLSFTYISSFITTLQAVEIPSCILLFIWLAYCIWFIVWCWSSLPCCPHCCDTSRICCCRFCFESDSEIPKLSYIKYTKTSYIVLSVLILFVFFWLSALSHFSFQSHLRLFCCCLSVDLLSAHISCSPFSY